MEFRLICRFSKNILFILLDRLGINAFFRWRNSGRIKVLMFHSISPPGLLFDNAVSAEDLTESILYLSKKYSILSLSQDGQIIGYCHNKVNVLLTFDDGFVDNCKVAAPILKSLGITAVFFVIADCLKDGNIPAHITVKSERSIAGDVDMYRTMTISQVRELIALGMTIGSHGCNHPDYTSIDHKAGLQDAIIAKKRIQAMLDITVNAFAFPWGKYQENQTDELYASYQRVFTTDHGFNSIEDSVFFRNEVANYLHLRCAASGSLDFFKRVLHK